MATGPLNQDQRITENTQKYDLRRNFFNGIVEASYYSTALLVAIRHFGASDHAKSLIAGGSCLGFLLAPGFLLLMGKSRLPVSRICALLMVGAAVGILLSATANSAWAYTGWVLLACVLAGQVPSLMVHIYSRNYRSGERGRKISGNLMLSAVVGAIAALIIGRMLDHDLNLFRLGAVVIFLFCMCTAFYHLKIPSKPLKANAGGLSNDLGHALRDRLFFWMLTGWMLMGIGNLITIPLRVEYLANQYRPSCHYSGRSSGHPRRQHTGMGLGIRPVQSRLRTHFHQPFLFIRIVPLLPDPKPHLALFCIRLDRMGCRRRNDGLDIVGHSSCSDGKGIQLHEHT